ncbi:MAG: hypothetical protein GXP27_21420 [Planctomycetes bacterium]|nr:hypothetical protein [Planctomycetota bacterium]
MKQEATYRDLGWNFETIWEIQQGESYPTLRGAKPSLTRGPGGLQAEPLPGRVRLTWTPVAEAGAYGVYRADAPDSQLKLLGYTTETFFEDRTAIPETIYYYTVTAAIAPLPSYLSAGPAAGESVPDRTQLVVGMASFQADSPAGVTATQDFVGGVVVQWDPVVPGYYYRVYRSDSETGPKTPLGDWSRETSFTDPSVLSGRDYYYWVTAATDANGSSESELSGPAVGRAAEPHLNLTSTSLDFGVVNVGESEARRLRIENDGRADLVVSEVTVSEEFHLSLQNGPGSLDDWVVPAGQSLDIVVSFRPVDGGQSAGELILTTNAPGQSQVRVVLAGDANNRPTAAIVSISPESVSYSDTVSLNGQATDQDGSIVGYRWVSSLDGLLGERDHLEVSASNLQPGEHTIQFQAKDDDGAWSDVATASLVVGDRQITFSGYTWNVKRGTENRVGPGPNYWSNEVDDVWVDVQGRLHLTIKNENGRWYSTEVRSVDSLGYGEYTFYLSTDVEELDPNVVVGLFTYLNDTNELDVEFSRWGNSQAPAGQFVVQPGRQPGHMVQFPLHLNGNNSTHKIIWEPGKVTFQSYYGNSPVLPSADHLIREWTYEGDDVPIAGEEKVHMNLWLAGGQAPQTGVETEVIVNGFEFRKLSNVALDYGDAPAPYAALLADNGARHVATGPLLGNDRDTEPDGQASTNADGDDTNGVDDEDGVTFEDLGVGQWAKAIVNVLNAPNGAKLDAWLDFNGDGDWDDAGEKIFDSVAVQNGENRLDFFVPSWPDDGDTFARFRLSTAGGLSPTGEAPDGEVEDYKLTLPLANIGDYAWLDEDGDGIQDSGEPPMAGVGFELWHAGPDGQVATDDDLPVRDRQTTGDNGQYLFENVPRGTYYVKVISPNGHSFTLPDQGSDDSLDSDADVSGLIGPFYFDATVDDLTLDAGLQPAGKRVIVTGHDAVAPAGAPVAVRVEYTTSDVNNATTGLSLRMHYDSQMLTFEGLNNALDAPTVQVQNDTQDYDGDPQTDKYLLILWFDINGQFPGGTLPTDLFDGSFTVNPNAQPGETTVVRFTGTPPVGYGFEGNSATVTVGWPFCLDVDGDGQALPLSDGILIIRYLAGFTDGPLTEGAVNPDGQRTDPDEIIAYLECEPPVSGRGRGRSRTGSERRDSDHPVPGGIYGWPVDGRGGQSRWAADRSGRDYRVLGSIPKLRWPGRSTLAVAVSR